MATRQAVATEQLQQLRVRVWKDVDLIDFHASLLSSPEPPYGHPDRLGVGLTCRLSDYSFVVQHYIDSSPDPQAHACAESKRVGGIALADAVDARLTAAAVVGIRRKPQCWSNIAASMSLDQEQGFLGELGNAVDAFGRPSVPRPNARSIPITISSTGSGQNRDYRSLRNFLFNAFAASVRLRVEA
jgi:hypothetical protein